MKNPFKIKNEEKLKISLVRWSTLHAIITVAASQIRILSTYTKTLKNCFWLKDDFLHDLSALVQHRGYLILLSTDQHNIFQTSSEHTFATSFSGIIQGVHSIHGSYNVPNTPGTLTSRNSTIKVVKIGLGGRREVQNGQIKNSYWCFGWALICDIWSGFVKNQRDIVREEE